ncbi:sulfite exporter TauE/SafE family protein [Stella sp.]|uniref:sulfite exporter TauE/SafE family protein n=1 Tax=Stella sp. TaxID=2912054 RepID=UPI0035B05DAF
MTVYLPIAEMSVSIFLLIGLGAGVGFLGGVFGVGGGFLMTPFLIFIGVPPAVAVASTANQVIAGGVTSAYAHWRRRTIDLRMAGVVVAGGFVGSVAGVLLFGLLRRFGQIDLFISLSYVVLLGTVGILMAIEATRTLMRRRHAAAGRRRLHEHFWMHGLPFKVRFPRSRLYISVLMPLLLSFGIGILSGVMGVGGGFVMVPAMIYLLGMPTQVVPGTAQVQIVFVAASATLLQAIQHQTVDALLAFILLIGGVVGSHFGSVMSARLRGEQLRGLLALLLLAVAGKLLVDLLLTPGDLFTVVTQRQ